MMYRFLQGCQVYVRMTYFCKGVRFTKMKDFCRNVIVLWLTFVYHGNIYSVFEDLCVVFRTDRMLFSHRFRRQRPSNRRETDRARH